MEMMKKGVLLLKILFAGFYCGAQMPAVNNGLLISINGANAIINGDIYHQNDGIIHNSGNLHITGNLTNNNAGNNVFANGLGGWVYLDGANQNISGTNSTLFNKLSCSGTGIKQLMNTDAMVEDSLALNDREFFTGNNTLFVSGTSENLVTRTSGFVSSADTGGLARNTNTSGIYLFPVGAGSPSVKYRPIEIRPSSVSANTFKVRMANVDAGAEGFDRSFTDTSVCEINPSFYHRIYRLSGISPADISMYFDPSADGNFQTMAHWQNQPQWESTANVSASSFPPFTSLTTTAWNDFSYSAFALAKKSPVASLATSAVCEGTEAVFSAPRGFSHYDFFVNGTLAQSGAAGNYTSSDLSSGDLVGVVLYDTVSCPSDTVQTAVVLNPQPSVSASADDTLISIGESAIVTASGAQSYLWLPENTTVSSFTVSPENTTTYTVIGTDANGCSDTSEITVTVNEDCIHELPNIFSPNGDTKNDKFRVLGQGLEWINLSVYDRWGNKVYETNDIANGWDGTHSGKEINSAVFVYILKGKCLSSGELFEQHGNVTVTK